MKNRSSPALRGIVAALIALCAPLTAAIEARAQTAAQPGPGVLTPQSQMPVTAAAFSPDGRLVVAGGGLSGSPTLRLWDVVWGIPIHAFYGHQDMVTAVAYSPDGKHIASYGGNFLLWDATSGLLLHELKGFTASIVTLAFSKDGSQLLSLSAKPQNTDHTQDTFIQTWDVASGTLIKEAAGPLVLYPVTVAFSPDGQRMAYDSPIKNVVTVDLDNDRHVWCTPVPCSGLRLWSVKTGAPVPGFNQSTAKWPWGPGDPWLGHFAFTPDGKSIAAEYGNNILRVLDASSGALIRNITVGMSATTYIWSLAVSPDGKVLAADIGGKIALWDMATGNPSVLVAPNGTLPFSAPFLLFSSDGKRINYSQQSWEVIWEPLKAV